jgi:hypothetical protein
VGHVKTALLYSEWAIDLMLLPQILFLLAIATMSFAWSWRQQRPLKNRLWKHYHWLFLTHLLFFACAIYLGVLFENPHPGTAYPIARSAIRGLGILWYGSFASCAFWIWRMKGFRWFASSLMVLVEMPIVGALFVAGMSVTGDWL